MAVNEHSYYIELCDDPIRFEPISKILNVFFDGANKQVFAVRSGGVTGVVVKGPEKQSSVTFRIEDRGEVSSIKFSYDMKILAIQRSHKSVEFVNFNQTQDTGPIEYSQACKGKTTQILGFVWTSSTEIVFITSQGIEFYLVIAEKKNLKCLKTFNISVNWLVWAPENAVLLLSTGTLGNVLHPFTFKSSTVIKLPKFEVDLFILPKPPRLSLLDRDVTMANIYGSLYVLVMRPQSKTSNQGAEIVLYAFQKDTAAKKTDVLHLGMTGRFAINIVDNLIVVHHQASKTSMIFDIKLETICEAGIRYHEPVLSPLPIKPSYIIQQAVNLLNDTGETKVECDMYSEDWNVFQPDIIIDAKIGCMWNVKVLLEPVVAMIPDKCRLIEFLLLRQESRNVIIAVCRNMLTPGSQLPLSTIAEIFNLLNTSYKKYNKVGVSDISESMLRTSFVYIRSNHNVIDQSLMYSHVFSVFNDNKATRAKFAVSVYMEYIRSLNKLQIEVEHSMYELLINTLVTSGGFYQLHQLIQYHVLNDSKTLACLMLSLDALYPAAYQLALDMLKRLSTANDEIIEVLLSKHQVLAALRFIRSVSATDSASARKFLEAARTTDDDLLFYTVYKWFEQRNLKLRGDPSFQPGEYCSKYVDYYNHTFGEKLGISTKI